ncbi:hypothetical protein ADL21_00765 [Streptomyces albus subsp. albus]|nr:hypothetical protein ADL21_00765 [Streptomyces albus subsp. albus]
MSLRQYAYFALFSERISAQEITSELGIAPDEVSLRGSRRSAEPAVIPVNHSWKIVSREPDLCVDEQISRILDRLHPHTNRLAEVASRVTADGGGAVLQVVRYFNDSDQDQLDTSRVPNLYGWHLNRDVLDFLTTVGAELDVDEYDMAPDEDAG